MPVPFQVGLFLTVLVLAGVRFERSLREVMRAIRARQLLRRNSAGRLPGGQTGVRTQTGQTGEPPDAFRWGRWYHLAVLWGIVLFCVPFLLAVAFPGRIMDASLAVDRALTGGAEAAAVEVEASEDWDVPPLTEDDIDGLKSSFEERTARAKADLARESEATDRGRRRASGGLATALALVVALAAASVIARRVQRPGLMTALAAGAFLCSVGGLIFAGPISLRMASVERARRAVESCAAARTFRAEDAAWLAGPVKLVGRPGTVIAAEPGYLYLTRPGESGDGTPAAPHAGFRVGAALVPPAPPEDLRVVLPHVRLGHDGRELFIRADEDVLVIGCILEGSLAPRPGCPVIVAPAGARGVFQAVAADLLGADSRHLRYLVLLQLLFGALGAWFLAVICSAACEYAIARGAARRSMVPVAVSGRE